MTSSYVNDLRLNEMATGDASGTWGTVTNTNLELIGEALGYGTEAITTNADTHTSTVADGAADPARAMFIKYTGTLDSTCTITIAPNTLNRVHIIENATSGSQSIIISQGSGANVTILTGQTKAVYLDGAGSGAAVTDAFVDMNFGGTTTIGDNLTLSSDSAVVSFGADADTTLTHTDGSGLTLNGTNKLMFNDASQFIQGASATVLDIAATDEIELTATLIDVVGNQTISGTLGVTGIATFTDDIEIGDGKQIGTVSDNDAITIAANGQVTFTQTLIGTSLDISGDIDVDGTTNLDVVDVDGAVNFAADVTFADGADIITASAGTSNFRAGVNAGNSIASGGNYNVTIGDEAGTAISTGDKNIFIGYASGDATTTASDNTGVGHEALTTNILGSRSVAIGANSLLAQNPASAVNMYNTAVGYDSGRTLTTGIANTLIGGLAGDVLTDAGFNTAVGQGSLGSDTRGTSSTAMGYNSLNAQNFTGATQTFNTAIGFDSGKSITTGIRNTLLGSNSGSTLTDADYNVAVGQGALYADTLGSRTTALGYGALSAQNFASATDAYNTAVGFHAGLAVTTGIYNTIIGSNAGDSLSDADYNVALGGNSLSTDTLGHQSVAVGYGALNAQNFASSTNSLNTAIGYRAGTSLTTGTQNTAVGNNALTGVVTGVGNVVMGNEAGNSITSGAYNTLIGRYTADSLTTGSYNTHIGNDTDVSNSDINFTIAIGHGAVDKGTNTGYLSSNSGVYQGNNSTAWSTVSDRRIKKNIVDNTTGLDAINQVQVKNFDYRTEDEIIDFENPKVAVVNVTGTKVGVIAQEIKEVLPDVVIEQSSGVLSVDPTNLTWYLINAVQELSAKNDALEARITTLEGE